VLLRVVELGPPPEPEAACTPAGWRSALLAELPSLPAAAPPTWIGRAMPKHRRPVRTLITEAEARGLAGGIARAVLEVLEGRRPASQLRAMLDERAMSSVCTMLRGGLRWPVRRATLGRVHVYLPSVDAVEACVVFRCGDRSRALALRIDRERRRWVCTAVRIG